MGRHRKTVLRCNCIESTGVDTKAPAIVFLVDKENRRGERALTELDHVRTKHFLDIFLDLTFLEVRVMVRADGDGW